MLAVAAARPGHGLGAPGRHVLAAAIKSGAQVIVTRNLKPPSGF